MIVYFNNQFTPNDEGTYPESDEKFFLDKSMVEISPDDRGFTFGDGVYEVMKTYRGLIFELGTHLQRLNNSLAGINLPSWNTLKLEPILKRLIKHNHLDNKEAKIYVQITRGDAPRDHAFPAHDTPLTIFISAEESWSNLTLQDSGAKAITTIDERWKRCHIKQIGLVANVLANQEAKAADAYEAVYVRNGFITEGSHTNFCAIFNGALHTHPLNNLILPGVTRKAVLEICSDFNFPVVEEPIPLSTLQQKISDPATECMVLGTMTEIMPIIKLDGQPVGTGKVGQLTQKIQQEFRKRTQPAA